MMCCHEDDQIFTEKDDPVREKPNQHTYVYKIVKLYLLEGFAFMPAL